jgi:hypothetical protein
MFKDIFKKIAFASIVLFIFAMNCVQAETVKPGNLKSAFDDKDNGALKGFADSAGYDVAKNNDPNTVIGAAIKAFLSILGVVFLFLIIYGGWLWMTAQGNEQKVDQAMGTIRTAIIGLIIILAAYAISYYVFSVLATGTLDKVL